RRHTRFSRDWSSDVCSSDLGVPAPNDPLDGLRRLMGSPDLCSKRWIWEQYDHMVMADTVQRPGGDAAVVRVHGTRKALAMTSDEIGRASCRERGAIAGGAVA